MYEPTRGGTRGGQAEFKWTDVSADKDREHYLGHSINAPTGRWQKNKDVHWYNRDKAQSDDAKAQELAKIKEAEREAMSVALGFKASKPVGDSTTSGANAIPVAGVGGSSTGPGPSIHHSPGHEEEDNNTPGGSDGGDKKLTKEEKRARKAEKKLAKEERRREKQEERERRAMELVVTRQGQRSASPPPRRGGNHSHTQSQRRPERDSRDERKRRRSRSLTPLRDLPWMPPPKRDDVSVSVSPPLHREERSRSSTSGRRHQRGESGGVERTRRDYDGRTMERERANDRRRWEDNRTKQESARGNWDRA